MARVPLRIKFDEAIIIGGKEYEEVEMRVPKGKDMYMVSMVSNPVERDFVLISNLCNLNATIEEMKEIDLKEIIQLQEGLKTFL